MKATLRSIGALLIKVWGIISNFRIKATRWLLYDWNEFITIPIAVVLFIILPTWLRKIDPTSAGFDLGVLHSMMFAVAGGLFLLGISWLILKITMPGLYKYLDSVDERLNQLTEWERAKLSLGFYALVLATFLVLVNAIL